jgi:catechol 2,3-dioxygenase-like lactoylglutathione lyase family enzyme
LKNHIARISIVVRDYDEAIEFYTRVLGFKLIEDSKLSDQKRWVVVAPEESTGCALLLAKAANEEQLSRVGNQTGGRVFLFLYTNDFQKFFQRLLNLNVKIIRPPAKEEYGTVAVFADLYGNLWDLVEPADGFESEEP